MSNWGVRSKSGDVGQVKDPSPKALDAKDVRDLSDSASLKNLQDAVDVAQAHNLPGAPSRLIPKLSIEKYEPSNDIVLSALMGI